MNFDLETKSAVLHEIKARSYILHGEKWLGPSDPRGISSRDTNASEVLGGPADRKNKGRKDDVRVFADGDGVLGLAGHREVEVCVCAAAYVCGKEGSLVTIKLMKDGDLSLSPRKRQRSRHRLRKPVTTATTQS